MVRRLSFALLLACACTAVHARETVAAPGTEPSNTEETEPGSTPKRPASTPAPASQRKTPNTVKETQRGNPRWHSFLPGMFR